MLPRQAIIKYSLLISHIFSNASLHAVVRQLEHIICGKYIQNEAVIYISFSVFCYWQSESGKLSLSFVLGGIFEHAQHSHKIS